MEERGRESAGGCTRKGSGDLVAESIGDGGGGDKVWKDIWKLAGSV